MPINGNAYYKPIFNAVDTLVNDVQQQKALVEQRTYADKVKREGFLMDLIKGEALKPGQTPDSKAATEKQAFDFINHKDRTPEFFNNFKQAETQKYPPSKLLIKEYPTLFNKKQQYDPGILKAYEQRAVQRENNYLDYNKKSGNYNKTVLIGRGRYKQADVDRTFKLLNARAQRYLGLQKGPFGTVNNAAITNVNAYLARSDRLQRKPVTSWTDKEKKEFQQLKSFDPKHDYTLDKENSDFSKSPGLNEMTKAMEMLQRVLNGNGK